MGLVYWGPWQPVDAPTLDILNFAKHKRVTEPTVRRWIREGMPCDRDLDGNPRFNLVQCDAWIERRRAA